MQKTLKKAKVRLQFLSLIKVALLFFGTTQTLSKCRSQCKAKGSRESKDAVSAFAVCLSSKQFYSSLASIEPIQEKDRKVKDGWRHFFPKNDKGRVPKVQNLRHVKQP